MSESLAFLRLVWSRDYKLALAMAGASILGVLVTLVAAQNLPADSLSFMPAASLRDIVVFSTMLLTIVPTLVASLGLFNFQINEENLESPRSCCNHWLLRMPIRNWKIAIIPVVMKTIWIGICWSLMIIPIGALAGHGGVPWLEPWISYSAIAIAFLAVSWRPFRGGWWRVGALVVAAATSIGLIFLAYIRTQPQLQAWHVPGLIAVVAAYAGSVWLLLHSLKLARTQSSGIIAAYGPAAVEDAATDPVASRPMELRSPQRALVWHDLHRARHLTVVSIGLGLIPTLIFITWIGLKGATLFIALMISAVCSWSALAGSMYPINQRAGSVLPTYLVASPIASYRIAWTRLCTSLLIQLPFLLITLAAMSVWVLAKNNRAQWMRWAHGFADMAGAEPVHGEDDVVWIGIRMSAAIVIGSVVVAFGRVLSLLWVSMNGRDWLAGVFGCLVGAIILAMVMVPISWFFRYETLDEVKEVAWWWLSMVPLLIAMLLVIKALFALSAAVMLHRKKLAPTPVVARVLLIWMVIVGSLSVLMHMLIPNTHATMLLTLAATAVAVPLGSVLWMPISVDGDRHR